MLLLLMHACISSETPVAIGHRIFPTELLKSPIRFKMCDSTKKKTKSLK